MPKTMELARDILRRHFAYDDFRPGQIDVVASVLDGNDTLGVLPTGGGKSLCYQVPALARSGLTVVISPLISLMKDQVDRLVSRGVAATLLNSTLGGGEVSSRLALVARGEIKLLYVAPERFEAEDVQHCIRRSGISLLAVDEAHCISEWGHDFRPSFRRIAEVSLKVGRPQLVALTATATPRVRRDIVTQLEMRRARVIVSGFDRSNLHYSVRSCRTDVDKDRALLETVKSHQRPAIVYASTRASVERIAKLLTRSGGGLRALPYHAGLDDSDRHTMQEAFMKGDCDTIVATNAFGMGIDKPDVRLVVHYALPGTLEAYYQEAGRAGRDGTASRCVLLHAHKDRFTHEWFIRGMYPERASVEQVYENFCTAHVGGRIDRAPPGRDVASAIRLLERERVVMQRRATGTLVHVRLLATPVRIRRELGREDASSALDLGVLRSLWRVVGSALERGVAVNLDGLPPGIGGAMAHTALERLRGRQFVDFRCLDEGLYLTRPEAPLAHFQIDWAALSRRRVADLDKLQMMQNYAYTKQCRRAFVLRYFGETRASRRCGGCDNCLP